MQLLSFCVRQIFPHITQLAKTRHPDLMLFYVQMTFDWFSGSASPTSELIPLIDSCLNRVPPLIGYLMTLLVSKLYAIYCKKTKMFLFQLVKHYTIKT